MNIGDTLTHFELVSTDGNSVNSYDFADKYALLVIVSCNHCPYAQAYWTRLKTLANKYEEDNLGVVAISANDTVTYPQDGMEHMKALKTQLNMPFPYLLDEHQTVAKSLGATRTPEVFLFNSKRELVYQGAIDDNWENPNAVMQVYLEDAIEYTLDGLEIDYPEVPAVGCSIKWKS